jgi:hypothetical protein
MEIANGKIDFLKPGCTIIIFYRYYLKKTRDISMWDIFNSNRP